MTDLAGTFNGRRRGRRALRLRPAAAEGVRGAAHAPRRGLARRGPRAPAGDLVAGGQRVGRILNQRLADRGRPPIVPARRAVHAHPARHRHAPADGRGARLPGHAARLRPTSSRWPRPGGLGRRGHPEWGPFRLGKTNPNFSTSGLSALIAQYYAATGKTAGLTREDLARPEVEQFARGVESAVVHYGDITLTFLNNWYRADARGTALTYVSAVAVEEKSVIDYNHGNPDGILDPGEAPRPPKIPLVAIYPKEGTLFSDNPFFVLDADWVTAEQQEAAERFADFVQRPENQQRVLEFGFRPGNPEVAVGDPIVAGQRRRPRPAPDPARGARARGDGRAARPVGRAAQGGPGAARDRRVGLDGRARRARGATTKLDLAKQAAIGALDQFKDDDEVGLRIFSTDITGEADRLRRPRAHRADRRPARRAGRSASATWSRSTAPRSTTSRGARTTSCARATTRTGSTPSCC